MNREPAPAARFGARILALLFGKASDGPDAGTQLVFLRPDLPRRDGWADVRRPEQLPFDAFRGFRDPASPSA